MKTIYLGDRSIKAFYIEAWDRLIKIKIDLISRVRGVDGLWNYYSEEDLEDGLLVFSDVFSFEINPGGAIPHDYVTSFTGAEYIDGDFVGYRFEIWSADLEGAVSGAAAMVIVAKDLYIEDPISGKKIIN